MAATATLMDEYEVFLRFLVFQEQNSLKEKRVSAAPAFRLFLAV
jgi:hypothetical protein